MPPRRSARLVAAAEAASAAFPQLPHGVALRIFAAVPADARLRCAEVSRGWRSTTSAPELWRRLLKLGPGLVRKSKFMTAMRDEWMRSKAAPALPKRFAKFTWANAARGCGLNSTSMSNEVKQMFQMLTKCDDPQLFFGGENSAGDGQDDTSDDSQ